MPAMVWLLDMNRSMRQKRPQTGPKLRRFAWQGIRRGRKWAIQWFR